MNMNDQANRQMAIYNYNFAL